MISDKLLPGIALGLLIALSAAPAAAVEALSAAELDLHCEQYATDPEGIDGTFCTRYIQGFIDGAVATDERVMQNVRAEYEREETFSERAMRLRGAGNPRFPTFYAEFCLGEPVALKSVVEKVVAHLATREFADESARARAVVYEVLRREFPCTSGARG